ncbi:7189_t:CDS:2, partial [Dentiscutata erythropus]
RNEKFLTGSALYRINDDSDEFREFTYKGFTGSSDSLIIKFEKNSIILLIGRYIYQENTEFVRLIQTIPISSSSDSSCSPEDLLYSFSLLIYTTPAVTNSYKFNDNIGRQSFMLSKKLYNLVNGQKGLESNIIVFYTNANGRYDSLKESLKKSVISASYAMVDAKSSLYSSNTKAKSSEEFNNQLDIIEEQYVTMNFQPSNKRKRGGFFPSPTKSPTNNPPPTDLEELANQIRTNQPEAQQTSTNTSKKN